MNRTPVLSSQIRSIGYDATQQHLEIEFVSGEIFLYLGVPENVHKKLMSSNSHGGYYMKHIIHNYKLKRS